MIDNHQIVKCVNRAYAYMNSFPSYVPIKAGVANSYLINRLHAELVIRTNAC